MHEPSPFSPILLLAPLVPPGALILDIGCGTGLQAHALARAGFRVTAADMDFDAVFTGSEMREIPAAPVPAFLTALAERLPFPDAAFDAVLCLDVLHWSPDHAAFQASWDEAWRVLRAGGLFQVRCLLRDAAPAAVALGGGRYRLDSGAEWLLPSRADLDAALAAAAGEWVVPPVSQPAGGQGAAWMLARKSG